MTRLLIIDGHPDPARGRFVHALADAYAKGASGPHEVRRIDICDLDFPILRSPKSWRKGKPVAAIADAQQAILWAEHVVILFPLWLGDMPALLKGFLEQVARPNFAFGAGAKGAKGLPQGLLKGRSARIILTMGMPALFYTLYFRAHGLKALERNILRFIGFGPIRHSIVGSVEGSAAHRKRWLERSGRLGAAAA